MWYIWYSSINSSEFNNGLIYVSNEIVYECILI